MRLRQVIRAILVSGAAILLLVILADSVICNFTLHVQRRALGAALPGAEEAAIRARDGVSLAGWFVRPVRASDNGNCVIVLHGIADSRMGAAGFAPLFLNAGYSVLLPDSRAHGGAAERL